MSTDVKQRINSHNSGKVKSTKVFLPWKLVHLEELNTRIQARTREKYLSLQQEEDGVRIIWGYSSVG